MLKFAFLVIFLLYTSNVYSATNYKQLSDEEIQDFHDALNVIAEADRYQSYNTKSINKFKLMNEDVGNLLKAKLLRLNKTKIEEWQSFTQKYKELSKKHSPGEIEFYRNNKIQLIENGCYPNLRMLETLEQFFPTEQRAYFYAGRDYKYGFVDYCKVETTGAVVSAIESGSHEQVYNRKKSYLLTETLLDLAEKQYAYIQNKYGKYKASGGR